MDKDKQRAYSEIVEILKLIEDEEKIEKIPFEVIEMIKNNSDPEYKPEISKEKPLEEQNLSQTTFGILNWIASKYWEEDIIKINKDSEDNIHTIIYNDLEPELLEKVENIKDNSKLPLNINGLNLYEKIIIKIAYFLKKIFKTNKLNLKEGANE